MQDGTDTERRPEDLIKAIIIKNIVDSLPVGILVINPRGQISVANRSAAIILGYTKDQLLGKGWAELFLEIEENTDFNQVILDVIQEERLNLHRTVQYKRTTGEMLYLSMTTSFLKAQEGLEGIVVLLDDVTTLHQLQEREKTILEERHRIQREKAESLNRLAAAVAHQLRNPLTSIGGLAVLMKKKIGREEPYDTYFENILSDVRRLERIVKSVEEYTAAPALIPVKVDIAAVLEELRQEGDAMAAGISRKIEWRIHSQPIQATVDPKSFKDALGEIVRNAIEFLGRPDGLIEIVARRESDGRVVIEIADNGSGISTENKPFIFDPFFTTKAVGIGMGLCKVQRIMADHNGKIFIESQPGIGTRVKLEFPNV
ncbi:two-component system sensor histidine kinase NtrB [Desulfoferrobacter suflitae]|uniref:two-component system sensor histidine kinase NtrB n=1 Tax=Desulfoferrobacter suflitae TaxID=2865782 RepID=UPI0021647DBC|nr:ATP-binding protein [Desulfoferrobacter suflitae]MCK8603509.1 ATP-binding protein [Desulfoferrobacter suflitae]